MGKRIFTKEEATKKLGLPYGDHEDGYDVEIISDEISGQGRWETDHDLIFKYEGKFYSTSYSKGSTESQETGPWEFDDEVECWEVRPVEKIVTVYEPV